MSASGNIPIMLQTIAGRKTMPMQSQAQRRKLWVTNPKVAQKFEDETPKGAKLPDKVRPGKRMFGKGK